MHVSVEDPLDVSMEGDDGHVWDEYSMFSVETRPSDCVSKNLWDRDPVYEDPEGLYESGCSHRLCVGSSRVKTGCISLMKSLMASS